MKIYSSALRYARTRTMVAIPVSDLMTRDVVTIDPDADLKEAARRLSGLRISGMPVVDADNRVLGIISEGDLLSLAGVKKGPHLQGCSPACPRRTAACFAKKGIPSERS